MAMCFERLRRWTDGQMDQIRRGWIMLPDVVARWMQVKVTVQLFKQNKRPVELCLELWVIRILTGVSVVVFLFVVRGQKDIVLAGHGLLLGEVLILDFGKLDHCDGGCRKVD